LLQQLLNSRWKESLRMVSERQLGELTYVAWDTETTGLVAVEGRLVEIAGVKFRFDGTVIGTFSTLIDPLTVIPREVIDIHGITNAMVTGLPSVGPILYQFFSMFCPPSPYCVLLAHNAPFDVGFVQEEFKRVAIQPTQHLTLDTVELAAAHFPALKNQNGRVSLQTVSQALGIRREARHRALADAMALQEVVSRILKCYEASDYLTDVAGAAPYSFLQPVIEQEVQYREAKIAAERAGVPVL
jgi:DNA polymerase III epsilon subunit family exonuclease